MAGEKVEKWLDAQAPHETGRFSQAGTQALLTNN
jgi:hypothetical protein